MLTDNVLHSGKDWRAWTVRGVVSVLLMAAAVARAADADKPDAASASAGPAAAGDSMSAEGSASELSEVIVTGTSIKRADVAALR